MTMDAQALVTQWDTTKLLLARWRNRARLNQDQHWETAKRYERGHYFIGIPAVILSAIVGTTVFATLQKQVGLNIQLTIGAISVLAAVLAGLQTFLAFSKRAEQHKAVAAAYGAVRRRLETTLVMPVALRGSLTELVKEVEKELDNLARTAPTVPNSIYNLVKTRLAADPDTWLETPTPPPPNPTAKES